MAMVIEKEVRPVIIQRGHAPDPGKTPTLREQMEADLGSLEPVESEGSELKNRGIKVLGKGPASLEELHQEFHDRSTFERDVEEAAKKGKRRRHTRKNVFPTT